MHRRNAKVETLELLQLLKLKNMVTTEKKLLLVCG